MPVVNSPGLYFDPLGTLRYYNSYWNVLTFTDISYFKPHLETIYRILDNSKRICNSYPDIRIDCSNVLSPLEILYHNTNSNYLSLSHLTINNTSNSRFKRSAWFGIGGPILKQLFGSLDEDDAKAFTDAINANQDDQRHLASLMKQNIHVISSTISSFNNTIQRLNHNEVALNENMAKLDSILETISTSTNKLEASSHLAMTFSALESSLMILNFNLKDLIDSILFGKQNLVHPSILSPMQLLNELNSRNNDIVRNFPIPLSLDNIHILIDIADVLSFISENKLVFVVKIPLVLLIDYNLYHVYALPTPHDITSPNSFALISPSTKYLAITEDKLTYSTMNDLSECKIIKNNFHLCKLGNIQSSVSNPICEVLIFSEYLKDIPDSCGYKVIFGNVDIWQKLMNNKWIYVQSDIAKLSVNCNGNIVDHDVIGTGILTVPKNCKAYHKLLQFVPSDEYETKVYIPSPNFNIIDDDCCSKIKVNKSIPYLTPIKLSHINLDSLQYATHKLNQFNDELTKIENQPYHIKYGYYFSILTTLLSLSVFSYLFYKLYSCFRSKRRTTTSGCCVQIFNKCYSKPQSNIRSRSNIEMTTIGHDSETSSSDNHSVSNTSISSPRRNLEF